jgi:hypothetical protein
MFHGTPSRPLLRHRLAAEFDIQYFGPPPLRIAPRPSQVAHMDSITDIVDRRAIDLVDIPA